MGADLQRRRVLPRRLGWATLLEAIPGLAGQWHEVPPAFYLVEGDDVIVKCPCGVEVKAPAEVGADCVCGRLFLHSGDRLWVAYGAEVLKPAGVSDR